MWGKFYNKVHDHFELHKISDAVCLEHSKNVLKDIIKTSERNIGTKYGERVCRR